MQYSAALIPAKLLKRYKRFLADVQLDNGDIITAHCANTGAMTGCAEPGMRVWLSQSDNPKRKYAYTWELAVDKKQNWIGVNTHFANRVFEEAFLKGKIAELDEYTDYQTEVRYGEQNSRIDFLLKGQGRADCYVEVKSVTLLEKEVGLFPDAVTIRGQKHLQELIHMRQQGYAAALFFVVQHTGIQSVSVATQIDPTYAKLLQQAIQRSVSVIAYSCSINQEKIELNQALSVQI